METVLDNNTQVKTNTICHHCGEDCEQEVIQFKDHQFCCQGCQLVYQLLSENGLTDYYKLTEKPNVTLKNKTSNEQAFSYLDHSEIQSRFITFAEGNRVHTRFFLPEIHCTSCLWLLEKLPWLQEGIQQSRINYLRKEITIVFDSSQISLREVAEFLAKIGYPPHITLANEAEKLAQQPQKKLLYKLGITGFCMGNIMLISFPEYFGYEDISPFWQQIFGYLSFLFVLPIIFWSANSYLISAWQAIKHRGTNIDVPISLGILALFIRSAYEVISQTGAGYFDSLSALIFFLLIGKWLQERTFAHISFERDYKSYFPIAVTRIKNDQEESVPIEKLEAGDEIIVRNGELIPADATLKSGKAKIDFSFITGESEPLAKQIGELIYAGGRQQGGILRLILSKSVSQSYLTQLWNEESFQEREEQAPKRQNLTDRLSAKFTLAVLLIAIVSGIYWSFYDVTTAINAFSAVLIVACPCALALNIPFTMGNVLRLLSTKGLFVKNTDVIEQMANSQHLVFDKTGTITEGHEISDEGISLSTEEKELVTALASNSAHPMSQRIAQYYTKQNRAETYDVEEFQEHIGKGIEAWVNGFFVRIGKESFIKDQAKAVPQEILKSTGSRSYISINGDVKGYFTWKQALREGTETLVNELGQRHQLSLVSGDHGTEVQKVAAIFPKGTPYKFNQQPTDKMAYVRELQANQQQVMMLGDGLNDAGALKQADVGIAISEDAHQFSPASDAILLGKELVKLPQFLQFSRDAFNIVRWGYVFSIFYNIIGVSFAVQGLLEPVIAAILMPISSISVVGFGYLATTWRAKKLLK